MNRNSGIILASLCAATLLAGSAGASKWTNDIGAKGPKPPPAADMKEGKPAFQSMGPLAFGPDGILFVADSKAAAITAIATGDTSPGAAKLQKIDGVNLKLAGLLGTGAEQILIDAMAVNPISHNTYLAVSRGR